jgi:hypothetical protein
MDSFKLQFANGQSQYQTGSLLGTTYSEAVLIDQPRATTKRNIEQSVFRFIGVLDLAPDNDNWVDIKTVDKTFEFGNDIPANNAMTTTWGSWQSSVTGKSVYKVYERKAGDRQEIINGTERLIGTFTSYAEAVRATRTVTRAKIEVVSSSTSTRTGTHTTTSVQDQTETLGNFVTDVNIQPYIRPQTIFIRARGVKARTRFYVYFDGENMSSYVTPLNQYPITIQDINASTIPIVTPDIFTGAEGGSLISDDYGIVNFALRLPKDGKRFRTGTKEIIVTDSPTNAVDATTYAKGYFVSNGLSVNKQNTIVSTKVVVVNETQLSETKTNNNPQKVEIFGPSCMAYSFKIDAPINEPGVFLTSAEIYIAAVHPTLGVWFEIREMNSGGNITRTQVPYSEVWYTSAQIQPYLNPEKPTTPFKVTFPSPVFLQNDTQYAFVIHTEGLNPDTYFWVSRLGETDVNSGKQVVGRQLTGTLFTTNNNLNYDIVPDVDLTIKFNRADFFLGGTSPVTTQIVMGNSPVEFMTLTANSDSFIYSGETILGSDRLSLANVQGTNTISVGDYITGANSAVNAEVIAISSPYYYTTGISYSNGESISVYASNGSNKSINAIISSVEGGRGVLRNYSNTSNLMVLDQTNGKYFANAAIKGVQSNSVGRISSFSNQKYSVLNFKDHSLSLGNTSVSYEHRAYIASSNSYGDWQDLLPDTSELYDTEYTILSRSNEVVSLSGNTSTQIRATITTNTPWLSPIIDFSRCNAVFVRNILNNDTTGEDGVSGGNLTNKYISKTITLADGQDAEDILVKLTSYRPPNTDVKMWVKIRHAEDPQTIDEKSWSLMNYNESLFSSSANRNDFIEFDYTFPTSMMSNGVVYYVSNSVTFTGFKQFAIKIGLMGTDAANPPKVTDLRAIALQK